MASEFAEDFAGLPALHFSSAMEDSGDLSFLGCSNDDFVETQLSDLSVFNLVQCPDERERMKTTALPGGAAFQGSGASAGEKTKKKESARRGGARRGRGRCSGDEEEGEEVVVKGKDVVHVRAKRGQATDSHSLAERLRREKINEKMRCLQDLVPGCYKAMGTAVLLDEIINYVQSLQHQIEFLSMKLSAASAINDFNKPDGDSVAAHWLPASSGDGAPGWSQAPPPPFNHSDIFLEETFPLSTSVHQFPRWDSQ